MMDLIISNRSLRMYCLFFSVLSLTGCLSYNLQPMGSIKMTGEKIPVRDYLVGTDQEGKGYGLYSYLLFSSPPDSSSRARYEMAVEAYLRLLSAEDIKEQRVPSYRMNVTYLFLRNEPSPEVLRCLKAGCIDADNKQIKIAIDWIVANYNYPRAAALLMRLPDTSGGSLYIFSNSTPLFQKGDLSAYVIQDLSSTPVGVIRPWVKEFLTYSEQEPFGTKKDIRRLALHLISHIKTISSDLPKVKESVEEWIKWFVPMG